MKFVVCNILLSFFVFTSAFARDVENFCPDVEKVVIIGSGAAGSSAAIFAGQAGLNPLVIVNSDCNAQMALIHNIDNYPGIVDPIDGYELLQNFRSQAEKFGASFITETVEAVNVTDFPFEIELSNGSVIYSESLIIASGSNKRWLNLSTESELRGKGVVSATFCKDIDYKDKNVVVAGGGHAALQEALYISDLAKSITIINRSEKFNASKFHQDEAFDKEKIDVIYNSEIIEIKDVSEKKVTGVVVKNAKTSEIYEVPADVVIVAVGSEPNSKIFNGQLEMTSSDNIIIKGNTTATNVPGVFAAGDVTNTSYGRVVIAAGTGAMAALDAAKYLESLKQQKNP